MTHEEKEIRAIRDGLKVALEKLDAIIKVKDAQRQHDEMARMHGEPGDEVDLLRLNAREPQETI
ncbi:MAG TPA: hypothetical protein VG796_07015 [Verrucomicrobiales bacterium]|nr:hypothetical protein [Verrucomicrobiales bacterium]